MKFLHKKYQAKKKEILEVVLDKKTKVKFMTAYYFKHYEKGRSHEFFGGTFEPGTIRFVLPFDSIWFIVVEKGRHSAPLVVNASCRLLPPDRNVLSTIAIDAPADIDRTVPVSNMLDDAPENVGEVVDDREDRIQ